MFNSLKFPAIDLTWLDAISKNLYTLIIVAAFAGLFAVEVRLNRKQQAMKTARQAYRINLYTLLFNDTLLSLLSVSSLYLVAERHDGGGLLAQITSPFWKAAASLALLDLTLYFWHRASHTFECLWMFHKVHHSDPSMNVSTAFRIHFVELLLTACVKAAFIVTTGISPATLLAAETFIALNVMFHHADIAFRGERRLGLLFIAPHLHRVHHSVKRAEHDNNFGALLSIWDRLFGTFAELEPEATGLRNVPAQNFIELLKFGFSRTATASSPQAVPTPIMIAEAAYYRAEKRNFAPGFDLFDWIEAEKEIILCMGKNRQFFHQRG